MNDTEIRCLSCKESASYIGVSVSTFKRMVEKGDAPKPIQMSSRRLVWDRKQLDYFIDNLASF